MVVAVTSWGGVVAHPSEILAPTKRADIPARGLAYGCGRSYGDSGLNDGGTMVAMRGLSRFISFDRTTGLLTAESGVTLGDILMLCYTPNADGTYWFPPVLPGTRHVTLGGAIAHDVHGKNQAHAGSFGNHVQVFTLARSDGTVTECRPGDALFAATVGGMGLTGIITTVTLQLTRVPSLAMKIEDFKIGNLDDYFALSQDSVAHGYTVAWVDCLATGKQRGRSIFSRANFAMHGIASLPREKIHVPFSPPVTPLNRFTLQVFNTLYRNKFLGIHKTSTAGYGGFFFPLDSVGGWNKLYGTHGFFQFQCVLPPDTARDGINELLAVIAASGDGSFLTTLKDFGNIAPRGLMSFCMPGTTLALDFPNKGEPTKRLLARLEAITVQAGGRLYAAKDAVQSPETFRQGYPALNDFIPHVDPAFASGFWRRVTGRV